MRASVLLIDADPASYSTLRHPLLQEGHHVAIAEPGLDAIRAMLTDAPDLVILAVSCQSGDWQFCHRLLTFLDKPLLLLLRTSNPMDQVRGLELGADDCMILPVVMIEFLARVRALLRRSDIPHRAKHAYFVDEDLVIDFTRGEVWLDGQPVALTPTEFRLLSCFSRHVGKVLSYQQLTLQVWGPSDDDARNILKQHVHQLRQKLELNPRNPQRILTRRGQGYLFRALKSG